MANIILINCIAVTAAMAVTIVTSRATLVLLNMAAFEGKAARVLVPSPVNDLL